MSNRISLMIGGPLAILGAVATLAILTLIGIKIGDRLIYRYHLEGFSVAERRCEGLVPPGLAGSPKRGKCLRAELAKIEEPLWRGTFPLFLAAVPTSVMTLGGLAIAIKGRAGPNRSKKATSAPATARSSGTSSVPRTPSTD